MRPAAIRGCYFRAVAAGLLLYGCCCGPVAAGLLLQAGQAVMKHSKHASCKKRNLHVAEVMETAKRTWDAISP